MTLGGALRDHQALGDLPVTHTARDQFGMRFLDERQPADAGADDDAEALAVVDGFRRWRVGAFGGEILAALAGA